MEQSHWVHIKVKKMISEDVIQGVYVHGGEIMAGDENEDEGTPLNVKRTNLYMPYTQTKLFNLLPKISENHKRAERH